MRYTFLAAACTLGLIAALLALPPIGDPNAHLVAQTTGDRLAVATAGSVVSPTTAPLASRRFVDPGAFTSPTAGVNEAKSVSEEQPGDGARSLGAVDVDVIDAEVLSETEAAPTTTAPSTTAPPTSTTAEPTTTTPPPTTEPAGQSVTPESAQSHDGVLISGLGVVLPILGTSGNGWRVATPCANEITVDSGVQVVSVDFVLDPGHGGSETGAVAGSGVTEKQLNLRIAEIVEWFLERDGYSVLLTRRTDIRLPIQSRADIVHALEPKAFVSIHHNGGAVRPQSSPGTEVFVDGGNAEARRLGGILFEEMTRRMSAFDADWVGTVRNGVSTRLNNDGSDLYGVHRFTPGVPSVITEIGYLSNPSEAALFTNNDVQWAHGRAIADGLARWIESSDEGAGYLPDFVDPSSSGTGGFGGCTDPAL